MHQPIPPTPEAPEAGADEFGPAMQYSPRHKQPTYLPAPVPPPSSFMEAANAARMWIRIPLERPIWTPTILAVLAIVFIITTIKSGSLSILPTDTSDVITDWGAKINSRVVEHGEWYRLITATFLHSGLLHIASNGYALYIIGMDLEAFVGRARFLAIYAIAGLAGSVASFAFSPYYSVGVGASGAIFGLIGALAVYFGLFRKLFGKRGDMQFWNIIIIIAINLGFGYTKILPIDNSAHLGGLVAGALAGYVLVPRYKLGNWERNNVRNLVNINTGRLPWIVMAVFTLVVVAIFFVVLLLYKGNYLNIGL